MKILAAFLDGFVFIAVLSIGSIIGLVTGVWAEADRIARLWEIEYARSGKGLSQGMMGGLHGILRVFAFLWMVLIIYGLSVLITWFLIA